MKSLQECGQPGVDIQSQFNTPRCCYPQHRKYLKAGRERKGEKSPPLLLAQILLGSSGINLPPISPITVITSTISAVSSVTQQLGRGDTWGRGGTCRGAQQLQGTAATNSRSPPCLQPVAAVPVLQQGRGNAPCHHRLLWHGAACMAPALGCPNTQSWGALGHCL